MQVFYITYFLYYTLFAIYPEEIITISRYPTNLCETITWQHCRIFSLEINSKICILNTFSHFISTIYNHKVNIIKNHHLLVNNYKIVKSVLQVSLFKTIQLKYQCYTKFGKTFSETYET